jgi:hypothetical protein
VLRCYRCRNKGCRGGGGGGRDTQAARSAEESVLNDCLAAPAARNRHPLTDPSKDGWTTRQIASLEVSRDLAGELYEL